MLKPEVLDLDIVMEDLQKMLRPLIGEDIELSLIPEPDLGRLRADKGQIEQIVMNLAVNSRDAMPKGGRLTIRTANVDLDKSYTRLHVGSQPGAYVMLDVTDTGCGMDEATLGQIFEPFFTTKEQGKGTGLGMSTVYGIVKQSGGYIWVDSKLGLGTSCKIFFPRVEQAVMTPKVREVLAGPAGGKETILLVEDEGSVAILARRVLEREGYRVLEAREGQEALRISGRYVGPIHMILTDVVMPVMSGREVAHRLLSERPEVKVLYMSGYTDDEVLQHGILDCDIGFLQKPFTDDTLARKVLEREGYRVLEAREGQEALRISGRYVGPIHMILTDVVMPVMSGREVAHRLLSERPEVKVLYMSGYTDDEVLQHGILDCDIGFLQKPFTDDTLARKVREVLDTPA
ncbi:MAG: hybrid sensor histidine kinase/response regulator [Acidobacteria bacterium]|nr:MAG: hybrid sensor histidine kinase/response regulator [Acidobacteriota bacterium]